MGFHAGDEGAVGGGTPTGLPFSWAGYNGAGLLSSIPGWFYTDTAAAWNSAIASNTGTTPQATIVDYGFIRDSIVLDGLLLNTSYGYEIGNAYGGTLLTTINQGNYFWSHPLFGANAVTTTINSFIDQSNYQTGSSPNYHGSFWANVAVETGMNQYHGFLSQITAGNVSPSAITYASAFESFDNFGANAAVAQYSAIHMGPTFQTGSSLAAFSYMDLNGTFNITGGGGFRGISLSTAFGTLSATDINNYIDIQVNTLFDKFVTLTSGYSGIGVGPRFTNGLVTGGSINMYQASPQIDVTTVPSYGAFFSFALLGTVAATTITNVYGMDINDTFGANLTFDSYWGFMVRPNVQAGAVMNILWTGVEVGINNPFTVPNVKGINVDLSNFICANVKQGMQINDGTISVFPQIDTSVTTALAPFTTINSIGGLFHVAAGFPLAANPLFLNNLGHSLIFDDNFTADNFLGPGNSLGLSLNGFVNQIAAAVGKTADTVNYMMAGGSYPAPFSTNGTITNLYMYRAIGVVPGGGALTITNETLFYGDVAADTGGAVNLWGVRIDSTLAENFFQKSLAINTVSKKVSGVNIGLEIFQKNAIIDQASLWLTDPGASGFKTVVGAASPLVADTSFILPPDDGTAGYFLQTDGTGITSWVPAVVSASYTITPVNFAMSPYTVLATDDILVVDTSGGDVVINLLTAVTATPKPLLITKDTADLNKVILTPNGAETIAHEVVQNLVTQNETVQLWPDNVSNYIVN